MTDVSLSHGADHAILAKVLGRVSTYFPNARLSHGGSDVSVEGPAQFQNSRVYWLCSPHLPMGIVVKIFEGARGCAQEQFEALNRAWPTALNNDSVGLGIPRPLDVFPEDNVLVMEKVEGTSLKQLVEKIRWPVKDRNSRWPIVFEAAQKAGRWLSRFHQLGATERSLDRDAILSEINKQLRFCQRFLSDRLKKQMLHRVEKGLSSLPSKENSVWLHGDFKIDNILVGQSGVSIIDIGLPTASVADYDLASFCNSLDLLQISPSNVLLCRPCCERLKREFLSQYFQHDAYDPDRLQVFQLIGMIQKFRYLLERYSRNILARWYFRFWFHKLFATLS